MVQIGELKWKVKVDNASKAKEDAKEIEDKVNDAKESAEAADESTEEYNERLGKMAAAKQKAGQAVDKLNAKTGFLGSALTAVISPILTVVGGLTALKAIILGAGIAAALVALGVAFKENFGGMREHVMGFVDWLKGALGTLKDTALAIWNNFMDGFSSSGGSLKDLEKVYGAYLDDLTNGFQAAWQVVKPILEVFGKILVGLAGIAGVVIGAIIDSLAKMEEQFGMISTIIQWVTSLIAIFAAAYAIVQVIMAIVGAIISFISIMGSVLSAVATVISAIGTFIAVLQYVISVVGLVIGSLNPITLVILAIVAVVVALYAAWERNFLGIRDIVNSVVDTMTSKFKGFIDWLSGVPNKIEGFFSGLGDSLAKSVQTSFNGVLPDEVSIPSVSIGGETFGGGSIDIPQLDTGGYIEESGIAEVHKGETVVPADVTKEVSQGNSGGGGGGQTVQVDIGGIEIGDQSLDLSNLSRREMRELADLLAEALGDEVRNTI